MPSILEASATETWPSEVVERSPCERFGINGVRDRLGTEASLAAGVPCGMAAISASFCALRCCMAIWRGVSFGPPSGNQRGERGPEVLWFGSALVILASRLA